MIRFVSRSVEIPPNFASDSSRRNSSKSVQPSEGEDEKQDVDEALDVVSRALCACCACVSTTQRRAISPCRCETKSSQLSEIFSSFVLLLQDGADGCSRVLLEHPSGNSKENELGRLTECCGKRARILFRVLLLILGATKSPFGRRRSLWRTRLKEMRRRGRLSKQQICITHLSRDSVF